MNITANLDKGEGAIDSKNKVIENEDALGISPSANKAEEFVEVNVSARGGGEEARVGHKTNECDRDGAAVPDEITGELDEHVSSGEIKGEDGINAGDGERRGNEAHDEGDEGLWEDLEDAEEIMGDEDMDVGAQVGNRARDEEALWEDVDTDSEDDLPDARIYGRSRKRYIRRRSWLPPDASLTTVYEE